MMMPFLLEDINSLPGGIRHYKETVEKLTELSPLRQGVAYLTIDEKLVRAGQTHRRTGLHVDGIYGKMDVALLLKNYKTWVIMQ